MQFASRAFLDKLSFSIRLAFEDTLTRIAHLQKSQSRHLVCRFHHRWFTQTEMNERLQDYLLQLRRDLDTAGVMVVSDIDAFSLVIWTQREDVELILAGIDDRSRLLIVMRERDEACVDDVPCVVLPEGGEGYFDGLLGGLLPLLLVEVSEEYEGLVEEFRAKRLSVVSEAVRQVVEYVEVRVNVMLEDARATVEYSHHR